MSRKSIFVLSDNRSGSTLLDQLLGAHPAIISVGELHWLPAYANQDRTIYDPVHDLVCTCGKPVSTCVFWAQVAAKLGRPFDSLQLRPAFVALDRAEGPSKLLARLSRGFVEKYPKLFRYRVVQRGFAGSRLARDSLELFGALFAVSSRSVVVDSSKSPYRFRAIYDAEPGQSFALVLARDYRAVVHSKMKRGHTLESAALGWRNRMAQIDALTDDLPATRKHCIKYEDLCENPVGELTRICSILDLEFFPAMLQRPTNNVHHIGGSPSKFDLSRIAISTDTAYKTAFEPAALAKMRDLVGDMALKWGY